MRAWERNAGGTIASASGLVSTSTRIHALCTPSLQPHSAFVRKCDPVERNTCTTRVHSSVSASWGTSIRNFGTSSLLCRGSLRAGQDHTKRRTSGLRFQLDLSIVLAHDASSDVQAEAR